MTKFQELMLFVCLGYSIGSIVGMLFTIIPGGFRCLRAWWKQHREQKAPSDRIE